MERHRSAFVPMALKTFNRVWLMAVAGNYVRAGQVRQAVMRVQNGVIRQMISAGRIHPTRKEGACAGRQHNDYCEQLIFDGHDDWWLPELR